GMSTNSTATVLLASIRQGQARTRRYPNGPACPWSHGHSLTVALGPPSPAASHPGGIRVARMLDRLGRNAARHHWWFIGAWLVAAVLFLVIAVGLDGQTNDTF